MNDARDGGVRRARPESLLSIKVAHETAHGGSWSGGLGAIRDSTSGATCGTACGRLIAPKELSAAWNGGNLSLRILIQNGSIKYACGGSGSGRIRLKRSHSRLMLEMRDLLFKTKESIQTRHSAGMTRKLFHSKRSQSESMVGVRLETCPRQKQRVQRAYAGCGRLIPLQKNPQDPLCREYDFEAPYMGNCLGTDKWWERLGGFSASKSEVSAAYAGCERLAPLQKEPDV
jgi:hypothetical protein